MSSIVVTIKTYGAMRVYGDMLRLTLPLGVTIQQVKEHLTAQLGAAAQTLVTDSVLANDVEILDPTVTLSEDCALAVLPPVCGG